MADFLQAWSYVEELSAEDEISAMARHRAREYSISALSPATCAFLSLFTAAINARSVVELGTGTGVSGLALLRAHSGVTLTTIDCETELHAVARRFFSEAGFRSGLTRLITGSTADILPRLASSAYDLVLVDSDPLDAEGDVREAFRILRPGGFVVLAHALLDGRVADPTRRDAAVVVMRDLVKNLMGDTTLSSSLIPVGDGLLIARAQ